MVEEISLIELFSIFKKRMALIINTVLVGLVVATTYTFFVATPNYSATTQLLVNRTQETEVIQRSDIDTNVQLINTYSDIIRNPVILDPVIDVLELDISADSLRNQISITTENDSQVFAVEVISDNPYSSAEIANTIASIFQENLDNLMNVDNVSVISRATANINPISPNNIMNIAIGIIAGGIIGVGIALLMEFLDNSVKEDKFLTEELGWSSLGHISVMTSDELKPNNMSSIPQRKNDTRTIRSRV